MQLVILYGAEATGKLTIASQIAEKTKLKLFHNHTSIDVGKVLFEYGDAAYNELVWKVRLLVFEAAAKNDSPGLIFTWAYSHPDFQPQLDRILSTVRPYHVDVHYVYVWCSQACLEERVLHSDRKAAGKLHTIEGLHRQQKNKNHAVIPNTNSLVIDNTDLVPSVVADQIIDEFSLPSASA